MNLVLVGYRGTGKSVIAAELGQRLQRQVISLDAEIVRRAGRSIPDIVAERGWPGFRDLEESLCAEIAANDGLVVDCGGGIVERACNVERLRERGHLVWLKAEVPTIVARIGGDTQRPSLTGKSFVDEVAEVLERRTPLYRAAAHHEVDTDGRSIDEIAAEVLRGFVV